MLLDFIPYPEIHVCYMFFSCFVEFDDYAEIVDDDPDYAHPMAGRFVMLLKKIFRKENSI